MLKNNVAQCLVCGDVIESKHQHDYRVCSCGSLGVDGGLEYRRRTFKNNEDWVELSGLTEDEMEAVRASSLAEETDQASQAIAKRDLLRW